MRPYLSLLIAAGVLSGCAAFQSKPPEPVVIKEDDKPQRTHRHLTVAWDNIGRGGAALHQPGFVDVLSNEDSQTQSYTPAKSPALAPKPSPKATPAIIGPSIDEMRALLSKSAAKPVPTTNKTSYAIYEMRRWERYCNAGQGMTEQDWKFVTQAKGEVPADAISSCSRPNHNYQGYKDAWKSFCSGTTISESQQDIVRNSTRPASIKSCKGKL